MTIDLNIQLTINAEAKFTKKEKDNLSLELKQKIKSSLELLLSDIPIPDHAKLLDGYDYDIEVEQY
tara:strand:- start:20 stop:217 length:198 start_codon:yes stop_codon:yes gene_type:complete